jgi:hypothetical protein
VSLCLLVCAPVVLADGCQLSQMAEVPLTTIKGGQVVVPVVIDGNHVKMAVDTTSSLTYIYSGAVTALNLTAGANLRRNILRVGATRLTQTVDIKSLKLANVQWPNINVLVYPLNRQYPPLLGEDDVVGSLGLNLFLGVDVELDFGAQRLRLYSQKHCPGEVVYWASKFDVLPLQKDRLGDSYITMMANGKRMEANLASMAAVSSMEELAASKVLGLDRSSAGVDAGGGSDGCAFCGSITLKAQGLEITNARVRMVRTVPPDCHFTGPTLLGAAARYDCAGAFPLHLGINVLSQLHLYFANGENKLYFTYANAGKELPEPATPVPATP